MAQQETMSLVRSIRYPYLPWVYWVVALAGSLLFATNVPGSWQWTLVPLGLLAVAWVDWLRSALPSPWVLRLLVVCITWTAFLTQNLAISFRGDIHPNLWLNSLLWVGPYLGFILPWKWILARWSFTPGQVLGWTGLLGLIVEQNGLLRRMLFQGQAFLSPAGRADGVRRLCGDVW